MSLTPRPVLVGVSRVMRHALDRLERAATTDVPVTIVGETGTGKDEAARVVHDRSARRHGPFVPRSCARLCSEIAESELFGHRKGAFSGAITTFIGGFAAADQGSFLLNELDRIERRAEGFLRELLDRRGFNSVGSNVFVVPDTRLIVASAIHPAQLAADGKLDDHVFRRFGTFPIILPPLRNRIEDIDVLLDHCLPSIAAHYRVPILPWSPSAMAAIKAYHWPGNVRQLLGVARDAMAYSSGTVERSLVREILDQQDAQSQSVKSTHAADALRLTQEAYERCGSEAKTARELGIAEKTVWRRLKRARSVGITSSNASPLEG